MSTPIAIEVNCETGDVTERPLTAEEIAQREADAAAAMPPLILVFNKCCI